MRSRPPLLGIPFAVAVLVAWCVAADSAARDRGTDARMRRVEAGLLPPILIRGERSPGMGIRQRMARWQVPGASIAVIDRGSIAWSRGYGVCEAGSGDSVTPQTRFQAGSVSKPVAAMTALRLVEEGRLRLNDRANGLLTSWRIPDADSGKGADVTLRMLLTHSAGLTVHGFPGYTVSESVPSLFEVLDGVRPANTAPVRIDVPPGSRFRYSGGGFCVVQQLLMDVVGRPYPEIVSQAVLRPAGMDQSTFDQPTAPIEGERRATGHDKDGAPVPGGWHRYPELAAAGLWTTPTDLARLALEVQASWKGVSSRVLSPRMTRAMLTPQVTPGQGIGWRLAGIRRAARFEHSGDTRGYACSLVAYLESGQGAVVMTNGEHGAELSREILRGIANEYGWPDYLPRPRRVVALATSALAPLVGRYVLDIASSVSVEIAAHDDSLFATVSQPSGTERGRLLAESPSRFFDRESGLELEFIPNGGGRARGIMLRQGGEEYRATRAADGR